jgi:hypothetical protein
MVQSRLETTTSVGMLVTAAIVLSACTGPAPIPEPPLPTAPSSTASTGSSATSRRDQPATLAFPGHLPGARARSTYAGRRAASASWTSDSATDNWLLRGACTSTVAGTSLEYEVSYATGGEILEDEEQLLVASGDILCNGEVQVDEIGKLKNGPLAVEIYTEANTLQAYGIVVPGPG